MLGHATVVGSAAATPHGACCSSVMRPCCYDSQALVFVVVKGDAAAVQLMYTQAGQRSHRLPLLVYGFLLRFFVGTAELV
jgi:hypothetical protein